MPVQTEGLNIQVQRGRECHGARPTPHHPLRCPNDSRGATQRVTRAGLETSFVGEGGWRKSIRTLGMISSSKLQGAGGSKLRILKVAAGASDREGPIDSGSCGPLVQHEILRGLRQGKAWVQGMNGLGAHSIEDIKACAGREALDLAAMSGHSFEIRTEPRTITAIAKRVQPLRFLVWLAFAGYRGLAQERSGDRDIAAARRLADS